MTNLLPSVPSLFVTRYNRVLRFATVGVFATIGYAVIATLFYTYLPFSAAISSGLAYIICNIAAYWGHRQFTFKSNPHKRNSGAAYGLIGLCGYFLAILVPGIVSDYLGWPTYVSTFITCLVIPVSSAMITSRLAFGTPLLSQNTKA